MSGIQWVLNKWIIYYAKLHEHDTIFMTTMFLATRNRKLDFVALFHLLIHFVSFLPIFLKVSILVILKVLSANL